MKIKLNLNEEIADKIIVKLLKSQYYSILEDINKVKETNEALGIYSWDDADLELEELEKSLEHFDFVTEYFSGPNWKNKRKG